jgi:tetratricopeptide (TPR) repeat protein
MATEWYRKKGWSPKRREEFFTRLGRCRDKSEYVRVQAQELLDTPSRRSHLGALELFDLFLKEWPDDAMLSTALDGRAECFVKLGDLDRAVEAYREVFRVLRGHAVQTPTPLDFGWLVATTPLPKLYGEALRVLKEFPRDTFPIERFRSHSIQAFIYDARGQRTSARKHARAALAETEIAHSGMRYHPTFGLVQSPRKKLYDKLRRLAA